MQVSRPDPFGALGPATVAAGDARLWQGDALELLAALPAESVDLVLTSPPYNIGKPYEQPRAVGDYVDWCAKWLLEIERVLTPTGAAWINLGYLNVPEHGTAVPIPYLLWPRLPMHLLQEVVWQQNNGVACTRRLSPRNEKLLWLVKDKRRYVFNLDLIRDPDVLYPAQRRNGRLRCNPLGKNPGDVWRIARVTAGRRSSERTDHPAQMPLELARRVVLASSRPGDIVLDPFAGSSTTLVAAVSLGRTARGFELDGTYIAIAGGGSILTRRGVGAARRAESRRPAWPHVSGRCAYSAFGSPSNLGRTLVNDRFQVSEGVFLYALGIVIIATHPARFWLGFALAISPLALGPVSRGIGGARSSRF